MIVTTQNIDTLDFSKAGGLMAAVAQHWLNGEILMLAWMNKEALEATLAQQQAVFFSRSRQRLWLKGETSGQVLQIKDIITDCDRDALILRVMPVGPACHTGARSCFIADESLPGTDPAAELALAPNFLHRLQQVIDHRIAASPSAADSYTARLLASGLRRIAQKVGEEGLETALAGAAGDREELCNESADLLFHLLVLLRQQGLALDDVLATLAARHRKMSAD